MVLKFVPLEYNRPPQAKTSDQTPRGYTLGWQHTLATSEKAAARTPILSPEGEPWQVVVIGAGAAGLVAAMRAAERGRRTLLVEKNRRPGVKILMSGGTRCNITQNTDNAGIIREFGPAGRFLHSALAALSVDDTLALFAAEGLATKIEATGKIFPQSDRAADVLDALLRRLERSGCEMASEEPVVALEPAAAGLVVQTVHRRLLAEKVILTTGGQSYPGSGTTGDGYAWARALGHSIVTPRPALVPITVEVPWVRELRGITVPDTAVVVRERAYGNKVLARRRGSLLFTHFGLSGPVVLDVSRAVSGHAQPRTLTLECDFLPNSSAKSLTTGCARLAPRLASGWRRRYCPRCCRGGWSIACWRWPRSRRTAARPN